MGRGSKLIEASAAVQDQSKRIKNLTALVDYQNGESLDQPINQERSVFAGKRKRIFKEATLVMEEASKKQKLNQEFSLLEFPEEVICLITEKLVVLKM